MATINDIQASKIFQLFIDWQDRDTCHFVSKAQQRFFIWKIKQVATYDNVELTDNDTCLIIDYNNAVGYYMKITLNKLGGRFGSLNVVTNM